MDIRKYMKGLTPEEPASAHKKDLEARGKHAQECLKYRYKCLLVSICALLVSAGFACTGEEDLTGKARGTLGRVDFPISCSPAAETKFERGLALLHNMMYGQAEKEFASVSELDPDCAMAYWGVAMTYLRPLWRASKEDELKKGSAAVEKALSLNASTERERAYIAALEAFYRDWKTVDHPTRIAAWEEAQEKLHKAFPEDIDAGAFYALSHLATAPKGDRTFAHQKRAGSLMEELLHGAPEHPGLHHYSIHAYDNPMLAGRAVEVARSYYNLAPDVPHALHMPTHIFVRLGLWPDAIDWNLRSKAAAKRQSVEGVTSLHYPHAMDYLMYAYLQQAQDKSAEDALNEINSIETYEDSFASAYGIAAAQARYPLERRQWPDAAALEVRTHGSFPWDKYPWYEAITYFARGLGAARGGDVQEARKAINALDTFYERSVDAGKDYWAVLVDAQRKTVAAWVAFAEGDRDRALKTMQEAADIEDSVDKHPVTPGAVLPARELLGDMLVLSGKHAEAIEAYEAALRTSPNRFNSLYGAGHAAELAGNSEKAKSYYSRLVELAKETEGDRPAVRKAKLFINKN
jgi:tetratricopeptide (TPR) repeat protein